MGALSRISAVVLLGVLSFSMSALGSDLSAQLKRCKQLSSDTQRLQCFDALTDSLDARNDKSGDIAKESDTKNAAPIKSLSSIEKFGLSDAVINAKTEAADPHNAAVNQLTAHVTALRHVANGRLSMTLDNLQVWEQVNAVADDWLEVGQTVTIKSGALGSFTLKNEHGLLYKVHRVQ